MGSYDRRSEGWADHAQSFEAAIFLLRGASDQSRGYEMHNNVSACTLSRHDKRTEGYGYVSTSKRRPFVRRLLLGFLVTACIAALGLSTSEAGAPTEAQVKAAFLFNFAKFVEWPAKAFATASSPIEVVIVGDSAFSKEVEKVVKGKTVNGRKLSVKASDGNKIETCHILFIAESEKKRINKLLDAVKDSPTLTVGETSNFIQSRGMIGFLVVDRKVAFEINNGLAKKRGLTISSQLLKLAKRVKE